MYFNVFFYFSCYPINLNYFLFFDKFFYFTILNSLPFLYISIFTLFSWKYYMSRLYSFLFILYIVSTYCSWIYWLKILRTAFLYSFLFFKCFMLLDINLFSVLACRWHETGATRNRNSFFLALNACPTKFWSWSSICNGLKKSRPDWCPVLIFNDFINIFFLTVHMLILFAKPLLSR